MSFVIQSLGSGQFPTMQPPQLIGVITPEAWQKLIADAGKSNRDIVHGTCGLCGAGACMFYLLTGCIGAMCCAKCIHMNAKMQAKREIEAMFAAHGIQVEFIPVKNAPAFINVHGYPSAAPSAAVYAQQPAVASVTYQIQVPAGVQPGQQFQVNANGSIIMVQCPPGYGPGSTIQVQVQSPAQAVRQAAAVVPVVVGGGY